MTDQTDKRTERLKAALRENLRRRKAQVRGRAEEPDSQSRDGAEPRRREGDPSKPSEGEPT